MKEVEQKLIEKEKRAEKAKQELLRKQIENLKLKEIKMEQVHRAAADHQNNKIKILKEKEKEKEFKD